MNPRTCTGGGQRQPPTSFASVIGVCSRYVPSRAYQVRGFSVVANTRAECLEVVQNSASAFRRSRPRWSKIRLAFSPRVGQN